MESDVRKLPRSFYESNNVVQIAQDLLGKVLCSSINGVYTSGIIVETEAYRGHNDKASHSCSFGRTDRTEIIFGEPGISYVYLCYGIHHMFNVVTNKKGSADAILIRAIQPFEGIDHILQRRKHVSLKRSTGGGPGIVAQALGITTTKHYGLDLLGNTIWIERRELDTQKIEILASPRVGVAYAQEDAKLPWRFRIKGNDFTSPAE